MKRRLFDRLLVLFISIITIVILSPFLMGSILGQSILYVLAVVSCIATVYGLRLGKIPTAVTLFLGMLTLILGEISLFSGGSLFQGISTLTVIVFYGFLVALLIRYIVGAEEVTADILYGAVCVYLLIGIVFAMTYRFIDILNPAAFSISGEAAGATGPSQGDFTYYSFVTLTTLGYGDIQPVSGYARTFAFLEAIVGTLYVAILISRLVSLYITHSIMNKHK